MSPNGSMRALSLAFLLTLVSLVLLTGTLCATVAQAEDPAVADAAFALDYLEGHLPDGVELPAAMKRDGAYVLACENRTLDARAISATGDYGVWQISAYGQRERLARMGLTANDLFDPHINTVVAIEIWKEQSWRPWSCRSAIR